MYKRDRSESKSYPDSREEHIKTFKALIEEHKKDISYYERQVLKYNALARDASENARKSQGALYKAQSRLKELELNESEPLSISPGFHWERKMEDEERAAKRFMLPQVIYFDDDDNANDGEGGGDYDDEVEPTFVTFSNLQNKRFY